MGNNTSAEEAPTADSDSGVGGPDAAGGPSAFAVLVPAETVEVLRREMEGLGLSGLEARVVVAILQRGTANSVELAKMCGITRTNLYRLVDDLEAKRLVERVPGQSPAAWTSRGRDEVLDRIRSAHEERLADVTARVERVRDLLAKALPQAPTAPLPSVHLITSMAEISRAYDQMLSTMRSELLMLTRSPFVAAGTVNPAVIAALQRGVRMRVLYRSPDLDDPRADRWRKEIDAYHEAGVEARVLDELPLKLMVFDRQAVLLALLQEQAQQSYPQFLLVEHAGFASVQATAFEHMWLQGAPYQQAASILPRSST